MSIDWDRYSRFEGPWRSPGFLLWQISHQWQRRINRSLDDLDLTQMQFVLLAGVGWLTRDHERVSQQTLSDFCAIGRMQISQVVRLLERKRLLRRSRSPNDARSFHLMLTEPGKQRLVEALERVERTDVAFFSSSTRPVELRTLLRVLEP